MYYRSTSNILYKLALFKHCVKIKNGSYVKHLSSKVSHGTQKHRDSIQVNVKYNYRSNVTKSSRCGTLNTEVYSGRVTYKCRHSMQLEEHIQKFV